MLQVSDEPVVWCGDLHKDVTENLLYELFLQAGPLKKVKLICPPKGYPYAFITFKHMSSVPYALKLMNGVRLFGRPICLKDRADNSASKVPKIGFSSCPSTPILSNSPNPSLFAIPPVVGISPLMQHMPPHSLISFNPVMMLPTSIAPPNQHPHFSRSSSVIDAGHNGRNMHQHYHNVTNGQAVDHRSSYTRPTNDTRSPYLGQRDNRQTVNESSNNDSALISRQLQAMRQLSANSSSFVQQQPRSEPRSYHHQHHPYQQERSSRDSRYNSARRYH